MKLLLTGFDPFGGEAVNPAFEAVRRLPDTVAGTELCKLEVPTQFIRSAQVLTLALEREAPDAVLCVGQAGGRAAITPERVAINCMDASQPDNAGFQPVDLPIREQGPTAYFSTLPIRGIAAKLRQAGLPTQISNSAGTFVCNALMYTLLHWIDTNRPGMPGGFLHVPYCTQQLPGKPAGTPALELDAIVLGLRCAVEAIAEGCV